MNLAGALCWKMEKQVRTLRMLINGSRVNFLPGDPRREEE
jgi:hypothetical protein